MKLPLVFLLALVATVAAVHSTPENQATDSKNAPSLKHAASLFQQGHHDAAAAEYKAIIAAGSQTAEAYTGLTRVYIKMGNIEDAYAASTKAVELAPELTDAHVARGEVYFRQGKIGEAEQEFVAMIRKGTLNARAYLGEARVSSATSFDKQAKEMITMAYGLDHSDPEILRFRDAVLTVKERIQDLEQNLPADAAADTPEQSTRRKLVNELRNDTGELGHSCTLVSKTKSAQTDLWKLNSEPGEPRAYGLRVAVNDVSTMLVVDTGRSGILIDQTVAARSGVRRLRNIALDGAGIQTMSRGYQGVATSLKIANLEFRDCYVNVMENDSALGQDGVIGADVFSDFLLDLDFLNGTFSLSELPPTPSKPEATPHMNTDPFAPPDLRDRYVAPEMKAFVPAFRFGEHLLVSTGVNNSSPALFLLATGTGRSAISIPLAKEFTTASFTAPRRTQGPDGEIRTVYIANDLNLSFGKMKQRNAEIFAEDMYKWSNGLGTEISGILGLSSLQKMDVKIDYRDGLVQLNFSPDR